MQEETQQSRDRRKAEQEANAKPSLATRLRRHPYWTAAGIAALLVLIVAGVAWWLYARQFESTDDAFIDTRVVTISPEVGGTIVDVPVTDNQLVEAGGVLVRIDARDYQVALERATAEVDQAQASIMNLRAQIDAQQARVEEAAREVTEAEAAFEFAEKENTRYQKLLREGAGTAQRAQQAASDDTQKRSALAAAQANAVAAQKQIAVLRTQEQLAEAQLEQAIAGRRQAEINLSRTSLNAPVAGRATKITGAKGAYVQPGQAVMMFVPRNAWITANFKETQLTHMKVGQAVDIEIDAYPGHEFHGHVASIQAGSGAAFSLLPAENATGNYVKVVQRVPVKITFDNPPDVYLGPGMSVVPTVTVR